MNNNNKPKVSVLIPNYNYGDYIGEAIESVLNQTYKNFELIIVDNCSTDNSIEIIKRYQKYDHRVRLYINDKNIGMYRNYNQCLLYARGEYIKFLNADDKLHSSNLEVFCEILDKYPNVSLVTSLKRYMDGKDNIIEAPFSEGILKSPKVIEELLKIGNHIGAPTAVMFRRRNLNLGLFDPSLLMHADFDMWLRQLSVGDLYFVNRVLSYSRIHDKQATEYYLHKDFDVKLFNIIQRLEYNIYSIQTNRFGYDFIKDANSIVKEIHDKFYADEKFVLKSFFNKKTSQKNRIRNYIYRNLFSHSFVFFKNYLKDLAESSVSRVKLLIKRYLLYR